MSEESASLTLRVIVNGAMGVATTTAFDDDEIARDRGARARGGAALESGAGVPGAVSRQRAGAGARHVRRAHGAISAAEKARALRAMFDRARRSVQFAGAYATGAASVACGNTHGVRRYARMTVRRRDGHRHRPRTAPATPRAASARRPRRHRARSATRRRSRRRSRAGTVEDLAARRVRRDPRAARARRSLRLDEHDRVHRPVVRGRLLLLRRQPRQAHPRRELHARSTTRSIRTSSPSRSTSKDCRSGASRSIESGVIRTPVARQGLGRPPRPRSRPRTPGTSARPSTARRFTSPWPAATRRARR